MMEDIKLYDIKKGSRVFVEVSDGSKSIIFDHIDGMYSYCKSENGAIVHLGAVTPLEKVEGGYKIKEENKK